MMVGRELSGRVALVTGGMQGIGLGVAGALAEAGALVIIHDRHDGGRQGEVAAQLAERGAARVVFAYFDLADERSCMAGFHQLAHDFDVDVLVNNAGIQATGPLSQLERATWNTVLAVNLSAVFDAMQTLLPGMGARGFGRVINIASVHALVASVDKAAYVAAKHGLLGLTKVAALEYAEAGDPALGGVTVNAICPGWVQTELIEAQIQARAERFGGDREQGMKALLEEKQPSLRFSQPEEIGALVCFLCSPRAHNITGAAIPMDGGWVAR